MSARRSTSITGTRTSSTPSPAIRNTIRGEVASTRKPPPANASECPAGRRRADEAEDAPEHLARHRLLDQGVHRHHLHRVAHAGDRLANRHQSDQRRDPGEHGADPAGDPSEEEDRARRGRGALP